MRHEDDEPTHNIPMALQRKLVEAKDWYELRMDIPAGDDLRWAESDASGADLLQEIVEMCDETWGFAEKLPKKGTT